MPIIVPISAVPNGVLLSAVMLSGISVVTVPENATVTTLGAVTPGDGLGSTYFFQAASQRTIDNVVVVGTPTTGRWIGTNGAASFSGVGPVVGNQTGFAETFILLSGFAPVTYTLPQTQSVLYKQITVKCLTTGTATIRCGNATDLIYDNSPTSPVPGVASLTTTLTGGMSFELRAFPGRYYRVDKPASVT